MYIDDDLFEQIQKALTARELGRQLRQRRLDALVQAGASREAAERWVLELIGDLHRYGWHEAAELVRRLAFGRGTGGMQ
jgi:hypothetical protein